MTAALKKKSAPVKIELSSEEVERRVAILKRFRELLSQQRDHFRQYLTVLDKQKEMIERDNTDALLLHVELEEQIVSDIFAIQKVIDPLETMYQTSFSVTGIGGKADINNIADTETLSGEVNEVPSLRAALEELRSEAIIRSTRNRDLLSKRMEELRQEMKNLRNNYAVNRPSFSQEAASLIDING